MRWLIALSAALALTVLAAGLPSGGPDRSVRVDPAPRALDTRKSLPAAPFVDYDEQFALEVERRAVAAYLAAVEEQRLVAEYLAGLEAERQAAARRPASRSSGATVTGDCAKVAAVVGSGTVMRESGGNPGATNGIYLGCAQIGMPWWNGACSGLDWTNTDDQAACAQIVMDVQGPSAWAGTYGR